MIEQQVELQIPCQCDHMCAQHRKNIIGICKSPYCDYYRELCQDCRKDHLHLKEYLPWRDAVREAKDLVRSCLHQLEVTRLRKQADMEIYLQNNMVLKEIEVCLNQIKRMIEEKINNFKEEIDKIYQQHVKEKLSDLDEIIKKSQHTLKQELKLLKERPQRSLSKYFTRDLMHEVKYYDSYFNEIFIKKTRNFRSALQNDRILTLIVTFQQNLKKIFTFNPQKRTLDYHMFHIFRNEASETVLYTLSKDTHKIEKKVLPDIATLINFPEQYDYKWDGIPNSVFFEPNSCFYIVGEGQKPSRQIVKWDLGRPIQDSFFAVRSMQTQRRHFAVCQLGGQIYIVGGQNQKDGCLARCQKFVPAYSSQIYLIHSLNIRSSRHSLTTYKGKYILKFGGVRKLIDSEKSMPALARIMAPPEIYSIQTEEWSVIPLSPDLQSKFGLYPSIFKSESKNLLVILGGTTHYAQEKVNISIHLEDSKTAQQQLKIRKNKTGFKIRGLIHNSTIQVDEEEGISTFMTSLGPHDHLFLSHLKLHN